VCDVATSRGRVVDGVHVLARVMVSALWLRTVGVAVSSLIVVSFVLVLAIGMAIVNGCTALVAEALLLLGGSHHGQDLGESLSVLGNTFGWLSEGKSLPSQVVGLLSEQVDDALLAGSAGNGADVLGGKHGVIFVRTIVSVLHRHDQVVQVFNVFLEAEELLSHLVLVSEHVGQVVHQLLEFLHETSFQIFQVLLRSLGVDFGLLNLELLASVDLGGLQISFQSSDLVLQVLCEGARHGVTTGSSRLQHFLVLFVQLLHHLLESLHLRVESIVLNLQHLLFLLVGPLVVIDLLLAFVKGLTLALRFVLQISTLLSRLSDLLVESVKHVLGHEILDHAQQVLQLDLHLVCVEGCEFSLESSDNIFKLLGLDDVVVPPLDIVSSHTTSALRSQLTDLLQKSGVHLFLVLHFVLEIVGVLRHVHVQLLDVVDDVTDSLRQVLLGHRACQSFELGQTDNLTERLRASTTTEASLFKLLNVSGVLCDSLAVMLDQLTLLIQVFIDFTKALLEVLNSSVETIKLFIVATRSKRVERSKLFIALLSNVLCDVVDRLNDFVRLVCVHAGG